MILVVPYTPTGSKEVIVVSSSAIGITANLCGFGNQRGALCQVLDAAIYVTFTGPTTTPGAGDFEMAAGTFFFDDCANRLRFKRVTTDARVVVQAME